MPAPGWLVRYTALRKTKNEKRTHTIKIMLQAARVCLQKHFANVAFVTTIAIDTKRQRYRLAGWLVTMFVTGGVSLEVWAANRSICSSLSMFRDLLPHVYELRGVTCMERRLEGVKFSYELS